MKFNIGDEVHHINDEEKIVGIITGYTEHGMCITYWESIPLTTSYLEEYLTLVERKNTMNQVPSYTTTSDTLSIFFKGRMHNIPKGDIAYEPVKELLQKGETNPEEYSKHLERAKAITSMTEGLVTVEGNNVMFDGEVVHSALTKKLLAMMGEGFDVRPWAKFMNNMMDNPSYKSRKALYDFLEKYKTPITSDGHFLAFKRVRPDFTDIHTGQFNNAPGQVVTMEREQVDDDGNRTCSAGLHACASSYLDSFATAANNKTVVVKINPRDVVAIPTDYQFSKMRVCRYEVLSEAEEGAVERLDDSHYTDYDQEYDFNDDDWEDYEDWGDDWYADQDYS